MPEQSSLPALLNPGKSESPGCPAIQQQRGAGDGDFGVYRGRCPGVCPSPRSRHHVSALIAGRRAGITRSRFRLDAPPSSLVSRHAPAGSRHALAAAQRGGDLRLIGRSGRYAGQRQQGAAGDAGEVGSGSTFRRHSVVRHSPLAHLHHAPRPPRRACKSSDQPPPTFYPSCCFLR
jgi:hypothetical protein